MSEKQPNAMSFSTDDIYRGEDTKRCLTKDLDNIEAAVEALDSSKAPSDHTHSQSDIAGLPGKLTEIDEAIAKLQSGGSGGSGVKPMLIANMHLGKLDNNNGAELSSSTRICSDPFEIQNGKSYWQVNDKGVNMYILLYDADEVFLAYLGSFASGDEIKVNTPGATYMRMSSLIGEYDLSNEFRIYDVDPVSGSNPGEGTPVDAYTKEESDARFAPMQHGHSEYASADHGHLELHVHDNKVVLDGITAERVAAWDAGTGSGEGTPVDAYSKAESDERFAAMDHVHDEYITKAIADDAFAPKTHTHADYLTKPEAVATFSPKTHSHADYAAANHVHSYNELKDKPEIQKPYVHPSSHPASMITGLSKVATSGSYNDMLDTPMSLPANGGDADTVGGCYPSAFASANHSHMGYLSTSGGSVDGNINVNGIVRVNGQQSLFDSGSMITLSTNNRETMIAGSKIYSKTSISVSSDERLKENIEQASIDECVEFIKGIDVKTFNYIGNDTKCIGVIAQEIRNSELGELFVSVQPGEEKYLSVKATDLVFPLIATVQRLSAEIDELKRAN